MLRIIWVSDVLLPLPSFVKEMATPSCTALWLFLTVWVKRGATFLALTAVQPVKTMPSHGGISDLGGSVSLLQAEAGWSAAHLNGNMALKGFKEQVF